MHVLSQRNRAKILACDDALDVMAVRLYGTSASADRARVQREMAKVRLSMLTSLGEGRIRPGDLRR